MSASVSEADDYSRAGLVLLSWIMVTGTPRAPASLHNVDEMPPLRTRRLLNALTEDVTWQMSVGSTRDAGGSVYYYADVFLGKSFVRRIVMTTGFKNMIAAEVELTVAARKWVSEYEAVLHSGSTDFGELRT